MTRSTTCAASARVRARLLDRRSFVQLITLGLADEPAHGFAVTGEANALPGAGSRDDFGEIVACFGDGNGQAFHAGSESKIEAKRLHFAISRDAAKTAGCFAPACVGVTPAVRCAPGEKASLLGTSCGSVGRSRASSNASAWAPDLQSQRPAMRIFHCECGARVFFDNFRCLSCQRELGFAPGALEMTSFAAGSVGVLETPRGRYRKCANDVVDGVCNWLLDADAEEELCQACRLNNVIPDLSQPENRALWQEVEVAKRRLIYSLDSLGLPVIAKSEDAQRGLAFDIKQSTPAERVLTGHADGLITLNLSEAHSVEREQRRVSLKERYRTVLGHFRHEVGHYFWDRLVADLGRQPAFRAVFGDEQADYAAALEHHYAGSANPAYAEQYISPYAAAHPWEDFAECFAHYLHLCDTLETAVAYGLSPGAATGVPVDFEPLMAEWYEVTVALNALNRSMGLPDAYPFAISTVVKEKLRFIHQIVRTPRVAMSGAVARSPVTAASSAASGATP